MIFRYPLAWPAGWPTTPSYQQNDGGFKVDFDQSVRDLAMELERLGATSGYLTTDHELRVNGTPRRDRPPRTPGVALYFTRNGKELCIPCDRFSNIRANIRAIGLTLESIRRMERYGTSQMVEAAFRGFEALPPGSSDPIAMPASGPRPWHEVLGVEPSATKDEVRGAYRRLATAHHPDNGGDPKLFEEITRAYQEGMK